MSVCSRMIHHRPPLRLSTPSFWLLTGLHAQIQLVPEEVSSGLSRTLHGTKSKESLSAETQQKAGHLHTFLSEQFHIQYRSRRTEKRTEAAAPLPSEERVLGTQSLALSPRATARQRVFWAALASRLAPLQGSRGRAGRAAQRATHPEQKQKREPKAVPRSGHSAVLFWGFPFLHFLIWRGGPGETELRALLQVRLEALRPLCAPWTPKPRSLRGRRSLEVSLPPALRPGAPRFRGQNKAQRGLCLKVELGLSLVSGPDGFKCGTRSRVRILQWEIKRELCFLGTSVFSFSGHGGSREAAYFILLLNCSPLGGYGSSRKWP
ncbi:uncharacterized protein LOC117657499 [Pantherophis guttatus]|uniref:Uncharacterized protein LOC117657499 n=1 Tax=Pantherophis guttatus TaxID=94885 RepID=A0ABM3ZLV1_PANGU|nr:uncharacterized protein LOC117657499 [Pantherophis guttatus]